MLYPCKQDDLSNSCAFVCKITQNACMERIVSDKFTYQYVWISCRIGAKVFIYFTYVTFSHLLRPIIKILVEKCAPMFLTETYVFWLTKYSTVF